MEVANRGGWMLIALLLGTVLLIAWVAIRFRNVLDDRSTGTPIQPDGAQRDTTSEAVDEGAATDRAATG